MNATTKPISEAEQIAKLTRDLELANRKIRLLEEMLRLARIKKYGAASEKLDDRQLNLLELEPGVSNVEVEAESRREPLSREPRKKRPHPGRQDLPADLPRVEQVVKCAPEQCNCKACGQPMEVIGYDQSEQLDVEPARYFVLVTKREKRACRCCQEGGVTAAPLEARIIDKSLVSDRVVIDTVVGKYCDHLPLYRQSAILERETGVEIGRATMDGWVMRVGELLSPLVDAMRHELLSGSYVQADETPVGVQTHDRRGRNHQAYLWQYSRPGGSAVFDFRMSRGRAGPKKFLGNFEGILQTDGYVAYEHIGGPKMTRACCWAHARRKFFEAHKASPGDTAARSVVESIDRLFAVDGEARDRALDLTARDELRQREARPLLDEIRAKIDAARNEALPSSKLGEAVKYTLTLWPKLKRFLEYPELELSTNLAENSMRPVALGRKNWIHIGSPQAGPRVAAILSVVESCRRLGIPVREYLAAVLPGLANVSIQKLPDLTPQAWANRKR